MPFSTAFGSARAFGEVVDEPAVSTNRQVDMKWIVLGILECLESVDDELFINNMILERLLKEQQTMAAESCDIATNEGMRYLQNTGNLPQARTFRHEPGNPHQ